MDHGILLAARLGVAPLSGAIDEPIVEARPLAPMSEGAPSAAWIRDALETVARHQRAGRAERVWTLLRALEPRLPALVAHDPASAGRVLAALATQALIEGAPEAFVDRARRAAESFDRAGDAAAAAVERASLGAGLRMLGLWSDAEHALSAALAAGAGAHARLDLGRVHAARGAFAEARAYVTEARASFAREGARSLEGAARAWLALILAETGEGAAAELEARQARALLDASPAGRALAGAALARALLTAHKIDEALAAAERAHADALASGRLEEGEALVRITLVDVRRAAGDRAGAAAALGEARRQVLAEASKLDDPRTRRAFLEAIPEHRRALEPAP